MKQNNMKPTAKAESTLFPLEEIQADEKKRSFPYRGYHPKRESSSNKRNWMELYPDPKRGRQGSDKRRHRGRSGTMGSYFN